MTTTRRRRWWKSKLQCPLSCEGRSVQRRRQDIFVFPQVKRHFPCLTTLRPIAVLSPLAVSRSSNEAQLTGFRIVCGRRPGRSG